MPYNSTTGIISIDTSTTPNKGIEIDDIKDALDLEYDDIGKLIVEGASQEKINKYAMYKPIRSLEQRFANDTALHSAMVATGYGITVPEYTTISSFISAFEGGTCDWIYNAPRGLAGSGAGSTDEWFRMFDFNRYNGHAKNPCGTFYLSSDTVYRDGGSFIAFTSHVPPSGDYAADMLTLAEIFDYGTYYFGILMAHSNPTSYGYRIITEQHGISEDEDSNAIARGYERMYLQVSPGSTFPTGTWTVYPFITNQKQNSMVTITDASTNLPYNYNGMRLYPLSGARKDTIIVGNDSIEIHVSATAASITGGGNTTTVEYSFTVTNHKAESVTLSNGTLRFRKSGKTYSEALDIYTEKEVSLTGIGAGFTLEAGESKSIPDGSGLMAEESGVSAETSILWVAYTVGSSTITGRTTYRAPHNPELTEGEYSA